MSWMSKQNMRCGKRAWAPFWASNFLNPQSTHKRRGSRRFYRWPCLRSYWRHPLIIYRTSETGALDNTYGASKIWRLNLINTSAKTSERYHELDKLCKYFLPVQHYSAIVCDLTLPPYRGNVFRIFKLSRITGNKLHFARTYLYYYIVINDNTFNNQ